VLLLRHGQSEWNAQGRWQGQADPALTDLGRRQAAQAGARLAADGTAFDGVVSSDLVRSLTTADIVAGALGLGAPQASPGLREFDVGAWSGLTRVEIEQRWPGMLDRWRNGTLERIPGGEDRDAFRLRILAALHALADRHRGAVVLAVTHGGVIGMLQRTLTVDSTRERITNLCGRWFEVSGGAIEAGEPVSLLDEEPDAPAVTNAL
jgi:broad specificity phosphatase PhoE